MATREDRDWKLGFNLCEIALLGLEGGGGTECRNEKADVTNWSDGRL